MGHAEAVPNTAGRLIAELAGETAADDTAGVDQLRIVQLPLVPEVQLYLAEDAIVWWARMEAHVGTKLPAPFWASAWLGGQALARYVLDHPDVVAGRRVLDVASGSGLVAIAASLAGAAEVLANDIDPYAVTAIAMNAAANNVTISSFCGDLLDGDGGDAEVVLAGDVFYDTPMAAAVAGFLRRAVARGATVLVGDPGRDDLPGDAMEIVATYATATAAIFADSEIEYMHVLKPRP